MNVRTLETQHFDIESGERIYPDELKNYIKIKSEKNVKNQRETKYVTWYTYWKRTKNEPVRQGKLF